VNGREAGRSGEWAEHFSNASCYFHIDKKLYLINNSGCHYVVVLVVRIFFIKLLSSLSVAGPVLTAIFLFVCERNN